MSDWNSADLDEERCANDSPELLEEIAHLRERLARLESKRPRCPRCFDGGWTEGGTPCGCPASPEKYRRSTP